GTVVQPLDLQGLDVEVAAESPDASVVRSVFGLPAGVDSYHLNGRVGWDGESWAVSGLDAHLGDSDLRGSAGYTAGGERPALRAELASDRLNLDQLRAFAAPADAGDGEDGPATGDDGAAGGGFDPERLLASLDDLRTVDAEIAYTAGAIEAEGLPVRSAALGVRLQDGVLDVQRLRVDLTDGGRLAGTVHIDAGRDPVPVEAALEVGETSLRVAGTLDRPPDAGPFGLDVSLRSPDPSVVTSLLGWPPDALPALAFEGRIGREGDAWVFDDFSAEAGPSDLRGSLRIDEGGERPSITG
ncbi:MAG TPA: AsmA family protein, partial [Geminicoccaceae bacterium]|nr:AsmA family protein [Geminicoccaceae bacterium]